MKMAADGCPICGHEKSDHDSNDGCLHDWEYGPDGFATVQGCSCIITGWATTQ